MFRHGTLSSVDKLDADLLDALQFLELLEIDRDTATIWSHYERHLSLRRVQGPGRDMSQLQPLPPLITRDELPTELARLERRGWIARTPKERWLITDTGRRALSDAENWAFAVETVREVPDQPDERLVTGRLVAGSMCFIADPFSCVFTVHRDGVEVGLGGVRSVDGDQWWPGSVQRGETNHNPEHRCFIHLWSATSVQTGDLLRYQEIVLRQGRVAPCPRPPGRGLHSGEA